MPGVADWRDPDNYQPDESLDWPAIAMGYLTRNESYQADHADALQRVTAGRETVANATRALIDRWGISLPVDPARKPNFRDVVVLPEWSSTTLTLVASRYPNHPVDPPALLPMSEDDFVLKFDDAAYIILRGASGDHRLWSADSDTDTPALLVPLDARASVRLTAAARLYRRLTGAIEGPSPLLPTRLKLQRHLRMLRLLDGRRAGARARLLASVLIDPRVNDYSAAEWVDCRQRKQIGRWTEEANGLTKGGYLALLSGN